MRQSIILFAIFSTITCCFGNPTSRPDGAESSNRQPIIVDIVIHNDSTNEFYFKFDYGPGDYVPVKIFAGGETVTNQNVAWDFWPSLQIFLGQDGVLQHPDVPMDAINEQLLTGKYRQVLIRITDQGKLEWSCGGEKRMPDPASAPPLAQASSEATVSHPAITRPMYFDVIIHNGSTNAYFFDFTSGLDANPAKVFSAGETITNTGEWWAYWPDIKIDLSNERTEQAQILKIPLTEVNDQLASGKCHRVMFQIVDPGNVEVKCD